MHFVNTMLLVTLFSISLHSGASAREVKRLIVTGESLSQPVYENSNVVFRTNGKIKFPYAWEFWTLFGEPVQICHAKWRIATVSDLSWALKTKNGKIEKTFGYGRGQNDVSGDIEPYDVKFGVGITRTRGIVDTVYAMCDPGVMSPKPNTDSFDTPHSPSWNRMFFIRNYGSSSPEYKTDGCEKRIGKPICWLSAESAKSVASRLLNANNQDFIVKKYNSSKEALVVKSLGDLYGTQKYDISGAIDRYVTDEREGLERSRRSVRQKKDQSKSDSGDLTDLAGIFESAIAADEYEDKNEAVESKVVAAQKVASAQRSAKASWESGKKKELASRKMPTDKTTKFMYCFVRCEEVRTSPGDYTSYRTLDRRYSSIFSISQDVLYERDDGYCHKDIFEEELCTRMIGYALENSNDANQFKGASALCEDFAAQAFQCPSVKKNEYDKIKLIIESRVMSIGEAGDVRKMFNRARKHYSDRNKTFPFVRWAPPGSVILDP